MQMAFYFDQSRCTGCQTCTIACKDWHDLQDLRVNWLRVETLERGKYPDVFVAFLYSSCSHCARPACADVCPVGAITKSEATGIVAVDGESCLGEKECGLCRDACPYQAPQFGSEENAKMQMCTFCPSRLAEGKKTVCVDACPQYALDCGPIDGLRDLYGDNRNAAGFAYSDKVKPSIIFKPKTSRKTHGMENRADLADGGAR